MKTLLTAAALTAAGTAAFATCDGYSVNGDKWMMVVEQEDHTYWFMGSNGYGGYDNDAWEGAAGILDTCFGAGISVLFTAAPSYLHSIEPVSGSNGTLIVGYLNAYGPDDLFSLD